MYLGLYQIFMMEIFCKKSEQSSAKKFWKFLALMIFTLLENFDWLNRRHDVNWAYIRLSEDDVFWTSYVRSIYVQYLPC